MSNTRSKFESKFKERTKLVKTEDISAQNAARQRQSRAAAINNRRAVVTESLPQNDEQSRVNKPQPRGSNPAEDRKALLEKWRKEKESRKMKEAEETGRRRGTNATQAPSKLPTKTKIQPPVEVKPSKPAGRTEKAKEDLRRVDEQTKRTLRSEPSRTQISGRSLPEKTLRSVAPAKQQAVLKNQAVGVPKNQAIMVPKKEFSSSAKDVQNAESAAINSKEVKKSKVGNQEVDKVQERRRGRPPLNKALESFVCRSIQGSKKPTKDNLKTISKERLEVESDEEVPVVKRRGRPPLEKNKTMEESVVTNSLEKDKTIEEMMVEDVELVPKKRGRPPLNRTKEMANKADTAKVAKDGLSLSHSTQKADAEDEVKVITKKRGRPPMNMNMNMKDVANQSIAAKVDGQATKRNRSPVENIKKNVGAANESINNSVIKKRGRPKKRGDILNCSHNNSEFSEDDLDEIESTKKKLVKKFRGLAYASTARNISINKKLDVDSDEEVEVAIKKRGRPSMNKSGLGIAENDQNASMNKKINVDSEEEVVASTKKRGRPSMNKSGLGIAENNQNVSMNKKINMVSDEEVEVAIKRRGRPSMNKSGLGIAENNQNVSMNKKINMVSDEEVEVAIKRRGRPSMNKSGLGIAENNQNVSMNKKIDVDSDEEVVASIKKRGRPSMNKSGLGIAENNQNVSMNKKIDEDSDEEVVASIKKRGRPSMNKSGLGIAENNQNVSMNKKIDVDSDEEVEVAIKRRGRPSMNKSGLGIAENNQNVSMNKKIDEDSDEEVVASIKKRGRPSMNKSGLGIAENNQNVSMNKKGDVDSDEEVEVAIKRRGRPSMNKSGLGIAENNQNVSMNKKGDVDSDEEVDIAIKKRGRPSMNKSGLGIAKNVSINNKVDVDSDGEVEVAIKKRGRPSMNKSGLGIAKNVSINNKVDVDSDGEVEVAIQKRGRPPMNKERVANMSVHVAKKKGRPSLNKAIEVFTHKSPEIGIDKKQRLTRKTDRSLNKDVVVFDVESDEEMEANMSKPGNHSMAKRFATPLRSPIALSSAAKSSHLGLRSKRGSFMHSTPMHFSSTAQSISIKSQISERKLADSSIKRRQTLTPVPIRPVSASPAASPLRAEIKKAPMGQSSEIASGKKRGRPTNAERRQTIGGKVPEVATPKSKGFVSAIATELRKRGRPRLNKEATSIAPLEDAHVSVQEPVEAEVLSVTSNSAVLGSVGRKRGRPPLHHSRRRTIAVGKVGTPKFSAPGSRKARRSLQLTLKGMKEEARPIDASSGDETDVDSIPLKKTKRSNGTSLEVDSDDNDVFYSMIEGNGKVMEGKEERMEQSEDNVVEEEKEDVIVIDKNYDDNILYSLAEEVEEEEVKEAELEKNEAGPEKNETSVTTTPPVPSTKSGKRKNVKSLLNMTAMEPLQSVPEDLKASESSNQAFKTPVQRGDKKKRYSMSVEMLKSDPKKCLKSYILKNLSPDERLEVLRHSPMIEMTRRKKSLAPKFQLDFDEEVCECKFTDFMEKERKRLRECCDLWKKRLEVSEVAIPEDVQGQIRVAVGKAELLMKERFGQFGDLIEDHLTKRSEKPVTEEDLQGFWDMVLCQVKDVDDMLDNLKKLEENKWVEEVMQPVNPPKKLQKKGKTAAASTKPAPKGVSKFAEFLKKKKMEDQVEQVEEFVQEEATAAMETVDSPSKDATQEAKKVFDGGFFHVESPIKPFTSERRKRSSTGMNNSRRSLISSIGSHRKSSAKAPFIMRDHSYAAKMRRESAAQRLSFHDFSMHDEVDQSLSAVGSSLMTRPPLINPGSSAKWRNFQNMEVGRFDGNESLNDTISQYLKPSQTSLLDTPLHRPRLSISTPGSGDGGDLMTFSPSTPSVKNSTTSLRKSVLIRSSRRASLLP